MYRQKRWSVPVKIVVVVEAWLGEDISWENETEPPPGQVRRREADEDMGERKQCRCEAASTGKEVEYIVGCLWGLGVVNGHCVQYQD